MNRLFTLALIFLCLVKPVKARERITSFDSNITINKDASMTVTETIEVISEGKQIKRGLLREFPTTYKDTWGNKYVVDFEVQAIRMNGKSAQYRVKNYMNGKRIYIGNPKRFIRPGKHTFLITYKTRRQLGFFKKHDELYWNVNGIGWRLPIDSVSATVTLPEQISPDKLKHEAYTGPQGARGKDYQTWFNNDGSLSFKATQKFPERHGLTIVVGWPKGIVSPPSIMQKIKDFFKDNILVLLLMLLLLVLLTFYTFIYITKCQVHHPSTIIPRFTPPAGFCASQVSYLRNMGYKHTAFACEVVDMARIGYFRIEHTSGFWSSTYTLHNFKETKKIPVKTEHTKFHSMLYSMLFPRQNTLSLTRDNHVILLKARNKLKSYLERSIDNKYIAYENGYVVAGGIGSLIIAGYPLYVLLERYAIIPVIIFTVLFATIHTIFFFLLKTYTPDGKKLVDEIDGFKMYLETAETERMHMIGTQPTKTPELYETYLPHAMALGVEKQWTKQFASVFARLKEQGHPYQPIWYYGYVGPFRGFESRTFSRTVSSSMNAAIASSMSTPGSGSGFGGRGSSGGGGGGGGGGGW